MLIPVVKAYNSVALGGATYGAGDVRYHADVAPGGDQHPATKTQAREPSAARILALRCPTT
jgi:hypothetical protein